jgi:hypothetical protein
LIYFTPDFCKIDMFIHTYLTDPLK